MSMRCILSLHALHTFSTLFVHGFVSNKLEKNSDSIFAHFSLTYVYSCHTLLYERGSTFNNGEGLDRLRQFSTCEQRSAHG